ncbi:MFS transporter [Amycolatopsis suaedae]|uniref:MFS transporter n=2 Tax=Amycolatopsis suaedae TaxID=2510978 RepID=A0A4Q7JC68_9PSEU|nr:MFS transporter [Amycolatopsis suaedae]
MYWRWSAAAQFARLPAGMAPLAYTIQATATTGSYRLGGVLMAVFVAAEIAGAVPVGRLLDRIGPSRGLVALLVCAATGMAGLATAAALDAPPAWLLAFVLVPGVITGGLSGGLRSLLVLTVEPDRLPRAIALDTTIVEAVLIAGPTLVALAATAGPFVPLIVMTGSYLVSALLVPRLRGLPETAGEQPKLPLRAALGWLACVFSVGHLLSTLEVATLPLARRVGGGEGVAALLVVVLSGASIVGGLLYAWRGESLRAGAAVRARVLLAGFVAGALAVSLWPGWPGLLSGLALVGLCTGPLVTVAVVELQAILPPRRRSEGFSVSFVVQASGFGLGSLTVGVLPLWLAPLLGGASALVTCGMLGVRSRQTVGSAPAAS